MNELQSERSLLTKRLTVALVSPVLLLIAVGVILGFQLMRMASDADWVDHTDEVMNKTNEAARAIIEQEGSLRGYLITGDRAFLAGYEDAHPIERFNELRTLTGDNPAQVARFNEIQRRYELWQKEADGVLRGTDLAAFRAPISMEMRMRRMAAVRDGLNEALLLEKELRAQRAAAAAASLAFTRYLFAGLIVATALVLGISSRSQLRAVAQTFGESLDKERAARQAIGDRDWTRSGQMAIAVAVQGDLTEHEVAQRALDALVPYVKADVGALYGSEGAGWERRATFALLAADAGPARFAHGEGVIGQAARNTTLVRMTDVPADFLNVRSGTGAHGPVEVMVLPAISDGKTQAVVELGFLRTPEPRVVTLLEQIGEMIAVAVRSAAYRRRLAELLEESQRQAEELQTQQEELRVANEELEEQGRSLRDAHAQLEERQHELEATNTQLEEQAEDLQRTQREVAEKATEVERASRYKSEFLANMSHELRTPLNSSLILAKLLSENRNGNLDAEQVRFAETIYAAGNDLLTLINDILDLSKIEAGKVEVTAAALPIPRLREQLERTFDPVARDKGLRFVVDVAPNAPESLETDGQKLLQILKNLIANALKFTDNGEVTLRVSDSGDGRVCFAVKDTGIGIDPSQHQLIFDAFRQADGSARRKHGGTGLGLAIARDLARLLGGDITVESIPGQGSTFTVVLPRVYGGASSKPQAFAPSPAPLPVPPPAAPTRTNGVHIPPPIAMPLIADDREHLADGKRVLLIIEDDPAFASILVDLGREQGFQCVVAHTAEDGYRLSQTHVPSAVLLDVHLPDHSGLSALDRLKRSPKTRHVPVHVVSVEDHRGLALSMGAIGYALKPIQREQLLDAFRKLEARLAERVRRVLVVEDDQVQRDAIVRLLTAPDVELTGVADAPGALQLLRSSSFDCVITDLTLPGMSGYELLETMANDESVAFPPVIVYTGRSLTPDEEQRLRKYSKSIIVKGARSPERLLDEVTLFLHQVESELPAEQQRMLRDVRHRESAFEGRRILVVEDDVRNVFALTSILEPKGASISIARNGKDALTAIAKETPDLVLMDIMMPEMDGLEAMREIRKNPAHTRLPIIALTAKAMPDDQERCIRAGANDYIAKPLDVDKLLSLVRVWMPR